MPSFTIWRIVCSEFTRRIFLHNDLISAIFTISTPLLRHNSIMPRVTELNVNGAARRVNANSERSLLSVLRDDLDLTGAKYGCGEGQCSACTVLLDGEAVRSCVTPVSRAAGKEVTTIEGLSSDLSHLLQRAWIAQDVPQCGYCQSGQIMSAAVLLRENPRPTDADIDDAMSGNICRCGTYQRIRSAIHLAAQMKAGGGEK